MIEGRAYELGNHRWHVECFRCSSCQDQLSVYTNMLILGDGTLVCAKCSYRCAVCNRKIMDMAVLTNEQAFCASCFVCRNCKNRIDDLQYARTSQGVFCMACHNALLVRKRQRQLQKHQAAKSGPSDSSGSVAQKGSSPASKQECSSPEGLKTPGSESLPALQDLRASQSSLSTPNSQLSQSAPQSSQASLRASRNKGLPDLPELFTEEDKPRKLRIHRKQLAPSALKSLESLPLENSASKSSEGSVDHEPSTPKRESSTQKVSDPLKFEGEPPLLQTPEYFRTKDLDSDKRLDPLSSVSNFSFSKSLEVLFSVPKSKRIINDDLDDLSDLGDLGVPMRSQLRSVSPVKSWWSQASDFSSHAGHGVPLFESSMPAAPSQLRAFGSMWHKRDPGSLVSTDTDMPLKESPKFTAPHAELGHKRSASENMSLPPSEQAPNLSVECSRLVRRRSELEVDVRQLEQHLVRLRKAQKMLVSRNKQLTDMNTELERQTLEKFGPNSLWGSQNPPASQPDKDCRLVTRLEPLGTAQQVQFLPLKHAKQWLFRKPKQENGFGGPGMPIMGFSGVGLVTTTNSTASSTTNKDSASRNSLIGDTLVHRVQIDKLPVPYLVGRCFAEVERRGLDIEGLYRKPGSKSQVDSLLEQFGPQGDTKHGEELLCGEIQTVTSAVKQYLRRLAIPVITYDCYESFIAAGNSNNTDVLRRCVQSLPPEHLATLRALVEHLALVASHEKSNFMNSRNLAMVFAPTIARDETGDREIPDMQARNEATHMLIVSKNIF